MPEWKSLDEHSTLDRIGSLVYLEHVASEGRIAQAQSDDSQAGLLRPVLALPRLLRLLEQADDLFVSFDPNVRPAFVEDPKAAWADILEVAAHARDELGISETTTARPVQAALTSAVMFSVVCSWATV